MTDNRKAKYDPENLKKPNLGKVADPTDYQSKLSAKPKPKKIDKSRSTWRVMFKGGGEVKVSGWIDTDGGKYTVRDAKDRIVFQCGRYEALYIMRDK